MTLPNGREVAHLGAGETALLYRDIFVDRCYLQHGISLEPGMVIFDVGANIGMSALFFHLECPGVTIHAFEPAPIPFQALTANVASHGIDAHLEQCALSDVAGTATMTYYPDASVMSGFHADPELDAALTRDYLLHSGFSEQDVLDMLEGKHDAVMLDCSVRTLSEVVQSRQVPVIDLLKVDVEKSELEVLRGIADADWPKVRQVVAEVHDLDSTLDAVTSLLAGKGFSVTVEQDALLERTAIYEVFAVRGEVSPR